MKTIRITDAGTYCRIKEWIVPDECDLADAQDQEPNSETIEYDQNYYDTEEVYEEPIE